MIGRITDRVTLNNGTQMPWLGFGVYDIPDGEQVEAAISQALTIGYRSVDTAASYRNERGVGKAIRESGIPREEIFLTTKLWNEDQRQKRTIQAFDESMDRLGLDYVDLYLIHWPVPGCYEETWQTMQQIYKSGRAKAIGVSNFQIQQLKDILSKEEVVPTVNQVEFHPFLLQAELLQFCEANNIRVEAWSPLMHGQIISNPVVQKIAKKHNKSTAQITLRWDIQHGVVTIPKSKTPKRIAENADIFDFELSAEDMLALDALDQGKRVGPDPNDFHF